MQENPFKLKIIATHMSSLSLLVAACWLLHATAKFYFLCAVALFGITQMDINSWQQFLLHFSVNDHNDDDDELFAYCCRLSIFSINHSQGEARFKVVAQFSNMQNA